MGLGRVIWEEYSRSVVLVFLYSAKYVSIHIYLIKSSVLEARDSVAQEFFQDAVSH